MPKTDVIIEDDIFLLYDDAGVNYIHFSLICLEDVFTSNNLENNTLT
jgi:hypothetical protein